MGYDGQGCMRSCWGDDWLRRSAMFDRGISDNFVDALKHWEHWEEVVNDRELFVGIRRESINIYFQGCSLFKISYREGRPVFETHYKYLVRPKLKNPLVLWDGERPVLKVRVDEIFIDHFDIDPLKKSSSSYAGAEKQGVQSILKSNGNVVDVEVALSQESEVETDSADQSAKGKRVAERIDFAAIQRKDGKPCIVFFEAKRFDNSDLRSQELKPRVFEQIRKYETFIKNNRTDIETSYGRVCKNLVDLAPDRYPHLEEVARRPEQLTVDSDVRLVVFGYDADQGGGEVWKEHKETLSKYFKDRLLLRGNPAGFTRGISR
jgi:hypothetical protein